MFNIDITGRIAVITGAGSGIGKSIATVFAKAGAKVIILERNAEAGKSVADEINCNDGSAESLTKKERLTLTRDKDKMEKVLGGIAQLGRLPAAIFMVDIGLNAS